MIHAKLSAHAAQDVRWPDLPWIVSRLGRTNVVLTHTEKRFSDGRLEITALHLRPPIHPALNQVSLDESAQTTLDRLLTQQLETIDEISSEAVVALIRAVLPPPLLDELRGAAPPPVVVVPDGLLWAVPWHAVGAPIVIAPSMTIRASIDPPKDPIRRIVACVDESIPGAAPIRASLHHLDEAGIEVSYARSYGDLVDAPQQDLLVVFAHGGGQGLDYRLSLPGGPVSALQLAATRPAPRALIASCWSARLPPVSFPLSVPATLLLAGARTVVGGLWPLPSIPTGEVVAGTLDGLRSAGSLTVALDRARRASPHEAVGDRLGLAIFGAADIL